MGRDGTTQMFTTHTINLRIMAKGVVGVGSGTFQPPWLSGRLARAADNHTPKGGYP